MSGDCNLWFLIGATIVAFSVLGFWSAPLWLWSIVILLLAFYAKASVSCLVIVAAALFVMNFKPFRRLLITQLILKFFKAQKIMPVISETERVALEAGTTWMDAELFSGKPNFKTILNQPYPELTAEEQSFVDNQVSALCEIASDWEIFECEDLPPKMWDYIKKERFLGLVVPKEFGGLGFSPNANSAVVQKLASHSIPLSICVMVPNSLGPAELILHYGTQEQKDHYLPRLADGREIPCFGLTEQNAGSDAGSMESYGVLFKDTDGSIKIKINWEKRYISLAAISTIIGLAVKLRDPDDLLGRGKELGITCILVPSNAPGVDVGQRHNPMGVPFYNCPTKGVDVILPASNIIGGIEGAGKGWQMLMESLAAGRAISLPALSAGGIKHCLRVTSAYVNIRKQFGLEIGKFEGIQEPLTRVAGATYYIEALRNYTCGSLETGAKPAVVSAIAKFISTEESRKACNDSMDILGGAGISRGPRNNLANAYLAAPIGITVEGANILTRTMIVFGQGAIRCHPYAYEEVKAVSNNDLAAFDKNFWSHVGFIISNTIRAKLLTLTRGYLASTPTGKHSKKYARKIAWSSALFAILTDIAMGTYGGQLKMREKMTGRYADVLSWLYIAIATMTKFEKAGSPASEKPFYDWSMQHCLTQVNDAFAGIYANYDIPVVKYLFRVLGVLHRINPIASKPSDKLGEALCKAVSLDMELREKLTAGLHISKDEESALGRYESTFKLIFEAKAINRLVVKAIKSKKLPKDRVHKLIPQAVEQGIITQEQANLLVKAETARSNAVKVDSFDVKDFSLNILGS